MVIVIQCSILAIRDDGGNLSSSLAVSLFSRIDVFSRESRRPHPLASRKYPPIFIDALPPSQIFLLPNPKQIRDPNKSVYVMTADLINKIE
jgi:hypothetical protein